MKKIKILFSLTIFFFSYYQRADATTLTEADTELCDTLKYALISSLREPIDQAVEIIYKDDKRAPDGLTWAAYQTEILKIKQIFGAGGDYDITLLVKPYYRGHITYGEDIIIVRSDGKLVGYKHIKTYPKVDF
ncbi:DUF3888 domain-containing protein [[Bacillus] enclensis]|uniref:DUF3888 domain-containing protein n=1 Tax=[Bacillus] enclensis TaxID=1402860 RepID=UPI0018DBA04B|nr:DUF3888 domain-containing protein [[Bacillus] enclensis]MBH9964868.1 DUF3888 domain-containing protein [[Bacillus] enclensis]